MNEQFYLQALIYFYRPNIKMRLSSRDTIFYISFSILLYLLHVCDVTNSLQIRSRIIVDRNQVFRPRLDTRDLTGITNSKRSSFEQKTQYGMSITLIIKSSRMDGVAEFRYKHGKFFIVT